MTLEDAKRTHDWLAQFYGADREVARQLLRKLTLVSEAQFDRNIQEAIESVLERVGRENVALLSVTEPPSAFDLEGTRRTQGSSADRVKHILENMVRVHGDRVRANPTVNSMRSDRIRNIVLVEDFIGSGDRIRGFWKTEVSKSVKSWISYGWTRPWIVSYAAIDAGIANLQRSIPKLTRDRVVTVLPAHDRKRSLSIPMQIVAQKYGEKLRGSMSLGYAGGGGTIVFQHGCPNNTPAILWARGKRFVPLFPDRGIPTDLQSYFGKPNLLADAENLWDFQQYRLALSLINHISNQKAGHDEWGIIVALAFSSRRGAWDDDSLQVRLQVSKGEIVALRRRAYEMSLIDTQSHNLTPFGRELLERLRKRKRSNLIASSILPKLQNLYYPTSCEGVPKL